MIILLKMFLLDISFPCQSHTVLRILSLLSIFNIGFLIDGSREFHENLLRCCAVHCRCHLHGLFKLWSSSVLIYIWLPFPSASCSQVLCNFSTAVDKYFSLGYFPYVSSPFFHLISTKKLSWLILRVCTCVHVHKRACWYFVLPYFCLLWCDEHLNLVLVPAGYRFLSYNLTEMNKAGLFKFNHRYMVFQTRYCR